ncbi:mitochondrial ornithine carrier protein AmcA/Ort1 [Purpureocillium lavendulum]|uniref:Mitochondrial ornithine carrier protein AmcA/Ort1 n=1 Tax=Purpureocillium lavendulum TaxID=1247861 RepID=A0AB34G3T0_9HYPO|nr:mitochondrial ornithine carrier protein AmcA/Ort1 [Purpureocillium lavendulum]
MPSPMLRSASSNAAVSSTCKTHNLTLREFERLHESAVAAKDTAYCPYSKFRVGAALLCPDNEDEDDDEDEDGEDGGAAIVTGANVENASYPVGTCAERVALGNAVTRPGWSKEAGGFKALAVATDISPPASPCGMCRQFIREFCSMKMPVIMFDKKNQYLVLTVEQLLPSSFGPDDLPSPGPPDVTRDL